MAATIISVLCLTLMVLFGLACAAVALISAAGWPGDAKLGPVDRGLLVAALVLTAAGAGGLVLVLKGI